MKSHIKLLAMFLFTIFAQKAHATAQIPDKLIYKGKIYSLFSNPVEVYFEKFKNRLPKSGVVSTALWRGYVATFEIVDSILYIRDIEVQYSQKDSSGKYKYEWKSALQEAFPDSLDRSCSFYTELLIERETSFKHTYASFNAVSETL